MPPATAVLISRDASIIEGCNEIVSTIGSLRLALENRASEAHAYFEREDLALVLLHVSDRDDVDDGVALIRALAAQKRPVATLVLAERYDAEQALTLLRAGAADFLDRPLDLGRLAFLIDTLTVRARYTASQAAITPKVIDGTSNEQTSLFARPAMQQLMDQVKVVAPQDTTILLGGETGTGKTHLARLIHQLSRRNDQPFLTINCAALAANLIESEMFGHVKGAFTGADRDRTGKLEAVGRGTLFFDDVDALPQTLQAKLLRAVEERSFEPVGSNQAMPVRARLIAASNQPLEDEVRAGRFRADLFYRLNVVQFSLPPLRERLREIPGLVHTFISELNARNDHTVHRIDAGALDALVAFHWPGNIRELRNVIERAVALCRDSAIRADDLPTPIQPRLPGKVADAADQLSRRSALNRARGEVEAAQILEALRRHGNNRLRTALELGISRMTLYKKLHKYGILGSS